jgi:hypothetical protein
MPSNIRRHDTEPFAVDFCTVPLWDHGQIVEENLFYDVVGMMQQLSLGS